MTCGGASVQYGVGPGSMLYESYPLDSTTWIASSKDHDYPNMAIVQVYAIGLSSNSYKLSTQIFSSQSSNSENPTSYSLLNNSSPDLQFLVSGGGAQAYWINYGQYLTASFPVVVNNQLAWKASSKDCIEYESSFITSYVIGLSV